MTCPKKIRGINWDHDPLFDINKIWPTCQFLATPGPFEYFGQKQGSSESQCLLDEGATGCQSVLGVLGGQIPRLYGGTIFGGVRHPGGIWWGFESKGSASENLCRIFLTPQISEFWPINWHRCVTICRSGVPYFFFFFYASGLRAMAVRKIGHFWVDRRIVDLHHEGSTILMQCHLGICRGPFYLPKATFWEFLRLTVFL